MAAVNSSSNSSSIPLLQLAAAPLVGQAKAVAASSLPLVGPALHEAGALAGAVTVVAGPQHEEGHLEGPQASAPQQGAPSEWLAAAASQQGGSSISPHTCPLPQHLLPSAALRVAHLQAVRRPGAQTAG